MSLVSRLTTPLARSAVLVAFLVGAAASVWRYMDVPPGNAIQSFAVTIRVPNSPGGIYFLPDTRTAAERADKSFHFDMSLRRASDYGAPYRCGEWQIYPGEWSREVPIAVSHYGITLCNDAKAPREFLEEMKPYLRQAALRDQWDYALRWAAVPVTGLLGAAAVILAALLIVRTLRWIRTGN